jgi:anti-sigma factor RsiW
LDAYLDGELDFIRRREVESHLPGCATSNDAAEDIATSVYCSGGEVS